MIVLDANILIRAVLGKRVRQLLETYSAQGVRFFAPDVAYADAEKYLPALLIKRGRPDADVSAALAYLQSLIETIGQETYRLFEAEARQRLRGRDEEDWPVLATAMSLSCAIWTEDTDFFGAGIAVWTSDRIEIFLKAQSRPCEAFDVLPEVPKPSVPAEVFKTEGLVESLKPSDENETYDQHAQADIALGNIGPGDTRHPLGLGAMIGQSDEMRKLFSILPTVAQFRTPVLIVGENGTGKELLARALHACGPNSQKPFVSVNFGIKPPRFIECELFGYAPGAFTESVRRKDGLLVSAEAGTVFIDEIDELSLDLQSKLSRALQNGKVLPVGAVHPLALNVRIVAATRRNLAEMVHKGTFLEDLYYRINVLRLRLPPLRDRREDIPLLAAHFLNQINRERGTQFALSEDALAVIRQHFWPGNVRELRSTLERASTLAPMRLLRPENLSFDGLSDTETRET
jgi:transcriptional regulator of acetoin/glycerol metabolism/predicted nucleic acid-binding protein